MFRVLKDGLCLMVMGPAVPACLLWSKGAHMEDGFGKCVV